MRKSTIYFFVALTMLSLGLALVPIVFSQPENIKVVSYSYYIDNQGFLDVVGEVQNNGPNTVSPVILTGTVYSSDGTDQADSYAQIGIDTFSITYLNPGQKAPFYMGFYQPNNPQGSSWMAIDVSNIKLTVALANATTSYQYPDLTITSNTHSIGTKTVGIDADFGVYWVNGNVQNTGSQTARNITVFGTFYNSTGSVVAVGYSNQIGNIDSSGSASFKLGAFDLNQSIIPSSKKIDHYSLLINALEPILQGTAPLVTLYPSSSDSSTQTASNSPTGSSSTSNSTRTNNSTNSLNPTLIAIIVVIAILLTLGAIVALKKRKPQEIKTSTPKKATPRKATSKRHR